MRSKPTLYYFVGFPGAGKTTAANHIHELTGAVHLWADKERQKLYPVPTHSESESRELYSKLNALTEQLLEQGESVIFDTNFNHKADRDLMRAIAEKHHAEAKLIWLTTPIETAKTRALHNAHRDRNGYLVVMSEDEFNSLSSKLEPVEESEQPIRIDGSDNTLNELKLKLGL